MFVLCNLEEAAREENLPLHTCAFLHHPPKSMRLIAVAETETVTMHMCSPKVGAVEVEAADQGYEKIGSFLNLGGKTAVLVIVTLPWDPQLRWPGLGVLLQVLHSKAMHDNQYDCPVHQSQPS